MAAPTFIQFIKESTDDGKEMVTLMLAIARNRSVRTQDRIAAVTWLADRAYGKPIAYVETDITSGGYSLVPWAAAEQVILGQQEFVPQLEEIANGGYPSSAQSVVQSLASPAESDGITGIESILAEDPEASGGNVIRRPGGWRKVSSS